MKIRKPDNADWEKKVAAILHRAFPGSKYEEQLVESLRAKDKIVCEWIAIQRNKVVGYIAFTNAYNGSDVVGLHLGPMAVHPDCQKSGIGSELIRFALRQKEIKDQTIFVLGAERFYKRFDFAPCAAPICNFTKNNTGFMVRGSSSSADFTIGYEKEFKELSAVL